MSGTAELAQDPLVERLRDQLPNLVSEVLQEPDVMTSLEEIPEIARQAVRTEIQVNVLAESDDLLRATNPEISALRETENALATPPAVYGHTRQRSLF